MPMRLNLRVQGLMTACCAAWLVGCQFNPQLDLLLLNGKVLDGTGNPWFLQDVGITADRITFVGDASLEGVNAKETLDVEGLLVTPGFWDVHSHANPDTPEGRAALPQLHPTSAKPSMDTEEPHRYSEGIVHAIVSGRLALKDGKPTGVLAGRPLPRRSTGMGQRGS